MVEMSVTKQNGDRHSSIDTAPAPYLSFNNQPAENRLFLPKNAYNRSKPQPDTGLVQQVRQIAAGRNFFLLGMFALRKMLNIFY